MIDSIRCLKVSPDGT